MIIADTILFNGRVSTMVPGTDPVSALAVGDGVFLAVGTDEDIMRLQGSQTQLIDLHKRRVIPGLNDSHIHVIRGGLHYNMELRWEGVPSVADAMRISNNKHSERPLPSGCAWLAAGVNTSLPSGVCLRWTK